MAKTYIYSVKKQYRRETIISAPFEGGIKKMTCTVASGRCRSEIRKNKLNNGKVVYNFDLSTEDGYGEHKQYITYNCALFSNAGKQEDFYDKLLVEGRYLMCEGKMRPGKSYQKGGVEITPWVYLVSKVNCDISRTFIMGRLTSDAVITFNGGIIISRFTIAVERFRKDGNVTDFIHCVKFGKGGPEDHVADLKKGKKVGVCGHIQTGSFINRDGAKVNTVEIYVSELEICEKQQDERQEIAQADFSVGRPDGCSESVRGMPVLDPDFPEELLYGGSGFDELMFVDLADDSAFRDYMYG